MVKSRSTYYGLEIMNKKSNVKIDRKNVLDSVKTVPDVSHNVKRSTIE
jgi:hypothetical protein